MDYPRLTTANLSASSFVIGGGINVGGSGNLVLGSAINFSVNGGITTGAAR